VFLVSETRSAAFTAKILASFVAFVLFVGFVARPAGRYIAYRRTPAGGLLSEGSFVVVVIAALLSALVTDAIGFKYMIGPMMLGLALGAPRRHAHGRHHDGAPRLLLHRAVSSRLHGALGLPHRPV
jgi:Kef-type K+ transport system membrane component KefB